MRTYSAIRTTVFAKENERKNTIIINPVINKKEKEKRRKRMRMTPLWSLYPFLPQAAVHSPIHEKSNDRHRSIIICVQHTSTHHSLYTLSPSAGGK